MKRYDAFEIIVGKPGQGDGQGAAGVQCGCLRMRSTAEQEGDRESPVGEIVYEFKDFDIDVYGYDSLLAPAEIERFEAKPVASLKGLDGPVNCIIINSPQSIFAGLTLEKVLSICNGKQIIVNVDRDAPEE